MTTASLPRPDAPTFFGHPRGLSVLFFTEMWERFSYYGMRALLILFMTADTARGGLGFDVVKAGAVYGLYTSMVYMLGLPGGWLADKLFGQRRAVLYGGIFIAAGHFSMAFTGIRFFYAGLVLIMIGTGLLKPNISTIVGKLYTAEDPRRDAGFSIFYMGINLGAFIAPLICGYLGQRVNWHIGFAAAGLGMTFGVIQYALGGKHLGTAGVEAGGRGTPEQQRKLTARLQAAGLTLAALGGLAFAGILPLDAVTVANGFGVALVVTAMLTFAGLMAAPGWTPGERKRIVVVFVLFLAASFFWSAFEQAGSTLNLFADRSTDTRLFGYSFPASWFQSVNSLFLISLAPVFAWVWIKLGPRDPSSPAKCAAGLVLAGAGFLVMMEAARLSAGGARVGPGWLVLTYLLHTTGELCLSPVGLSAMTRLAPARVAGLMMGVFFMSNSVGNLIGGRVASLYESWPLENLFGAVAAFCIALGLILAALVKPIGRMMRSAG